MERPGRLGAVIAITLSLGALSVYLLTRPSTMPASPVDDAAGPLAALLLAVAGGAEAAGARLVLAAAFGAVNVGLLYGLFRSILVDRATAAWLTVAFAFGTVHWWTASAGDEPAVAHLVAVALTLLAMIVALAGRWPLLAGLLLGAAAAARLPVVLAVPLFVALYAVRPPSGALSGSDRLDRALAPLAVLVGAALPLVYVGFELGGPLSAANIPDHLHAALLRSFDLAADGPWFRPNWTGMSLLLTSPFYLWLAAARSRAPVVLWSWVGIALIVVLTVLTPAVGAPQVGYRPSLDAAPLLFLLLGWVFRDGIPVAARATIVLAVAVNTYAMLAVGVLDPPFAGW